METSTLDRKRLDQGSSSSSSSSSTYPLYHTCARKKRVTIIEHGKEESEV
jgi:hypothetical protein